jgi:hypothetical protein
LRVAADSQLEDLGGGFPNGEAAAFDGTGHWLVRGYDDVEAARVVTPIEGAVQPILVSVANNSQWSSRSAVASTGSGGAVVWNDNRNDESDVYALALGADGCPLRLPEIVFGGSGSQTVEGVAADSGGFLVLGWVGGYDEATRTWGAWVRRLSPDGLPEALPARPLRLPGGSPYAVHANVHGGFSVMSGATVTPIDVDGNLSSPIPITYSDILSGSVAVDGGIAVISFDGACDIDCYVEALRISFYDPSGNELLPPVVEPIGAYGGPGATIRTTPQGYVVEDHSLLTIDGGVVDQQRAGLLSADGSFSGFQPVDAAIEALGRLPIVVEQVHDPPPRAVRLRGRRLDGGVCSTPQPDSGSEIDGGNELDAGSSPESGRDAGSYAADDRVALAPLEPTGGCGCRASSRSTRMRYGGAVLALLFAFVRRARRLRQSN